MLCTEKRDGEITVDNINDYYEYDSLADLPYQVVGKLELSPDSPFSFWLYRSFPSVFLLVNPFNFLQFYWLLFFILGFSELFIKAEISISLCTEDGMLIANETGCM